MTREIKFRVFDKATNTMLDAGDSRFKLYPFSGGLVSINDVWATKDCEVMQYSEVKDKNGKEIYEGDIFRTQNNYIGTVGFEDGYFYSLVEDRKETLEYGVLMGIEIIGNIYQNPELL